MLKVLAPGFMENLRHRVAGMALIPSRCPECKQRLPPTISPVETR